MPIDDEVSDTPVRMELCSPGTSAMISMYRMQKMQQKPTNSENKSELKSRAQNKAIPS